MLEDGSGEGIGFHSPVFAKAPSKPLSLDRKSTLEEYLQIKAGIGELCLLERYSKIHKIYGICEIRAFYKAYRYHTVEFPGESCTVAEILYSCNGFIDLIPDDFFVEIVTDWFALKNGFPNNLHTTSSSYNHLITGSRRVSSLVNTGFIHPSMTDCHPSEIKLCKATFTHLISHTADVSALMEYTNLDVEEASLLIEKLCNDQGFSNRCRKFIMSVGILNDTMFIIASFCNIKPEVKCQISPEIHKYYCKQHTASLYIPACAFEPLIDLSSPETYFMYLQNKNDIREDINDMLNLLKNTSNAPIKSYILDMILRSGHRPEYHFNIYKYLNELKNAPYFAEICMKYARELISDGVFDEIPPALVDSMRILDHLESLYTLSLMGNTPTPQHQSDISSMTGSQNLLENRLNTDNHLKRSVKFQKINTLPLISFQEHKWLNEYEKTVLLEEYIEIFNVDELTSNLIQTNNISSKIVSWFGNRINSISNNVTKTCVCCKLGFPFNPLQLAETEMLSVIQTVESPFALRHYVYLKKTSASTIRKFIEKLTGEQLGVIISELKSINPTLTFTLVFIDVVTKKYDLKHITDILIKLMMAKSSKVVIRVQKYLVETLESMFVDADYIDYIERLYRSMLGFTERSIRVNNDKILVLIGKVSAAMDKGIYIGNIKQID